MKKLHKKRALKSPLAQWPTNVFAKRMSRIGVAAVVQPIVGVEMAIALLYETFILTFPGA